MATDRLFVVLMEIGGDRKDCAIFRDEGEAGAAYFDAHHECLEGQAGITGDPAALTDCWLYEVATGSEEEARKLTLNGDAKLLSHFEAPDEE